MATLADREEENRTIFSQGEMFLRAGKNVQAKECFSTICQKTKEGILFSASSQYLAMILSQEGDRKGAYEQLLPLFNFLDQESKCLLHALAAEYKNSSVVAKLSKECYQLAPTQTVALQNARAFAFLKEAKIAGGWLQTAWQYGGLDLLKILSEDVFVSIRGSPAFEEFVERLNGL